MATWTNIPDSVLEPGKPARSVDALALRDNAIAIAEGAPGAPRIAGQQGPAVHTGGIANGAVTNAKIATMDASKLTGTINGARIPTGQGGVGTYAIVIFRTTGSTTVTWGGTVAGSNLAPWGVNVSNATDTYTPALSGTWRVMGNALVRTTVSGNSRVPNLAVRIS